MSGISINKHIYSILSTDKKLKDMVGKSIYPLIAEENTVFPFIIFKRNSIEAVYSKDGHVQDIVSISVAIATRNYNQNVDIAERVRELIELKRDSIIHRSILSSVNEDFTDDAYITELNFEVILK